MKKLLSLVLAAVLLMSTMSFAVAEDETVTLVVWSFSDEIDGLIQKYFTPTHPNIKIEYQIYPNDGNQYTQKVDSMMAATPDAAEAPDVFALEAAYVKKYVDSDYTADLLDLGFTADDFASCIPAMLQIGQNEAGVQKGLAWQSTPGALMYRASLAEQYLGVTTPEEMQEKVADWDTFVETAEELKDASNGEVKMVICGGDIWNAYQYQRAEGWVVDGKLVIDDQLYDYLDMLKTMEEDDLTHKGSTWSETWYAGMRGELPTLCFFLPTWGLHYTLKPNCASGIADGMTEEEMKAQSDATGGTYGDWRMVAGPVGYSWGGTWVGANAAKVKTADETKLAAMKELIRVLTLDEDTLYKIAVDSGDFVSSNAVVEKVLNDDIDDANPFLGGQAHYQIFAEAANLANGAIMSRYDETINSLFDTQCVTPYTKGEKDLDTAIADFKAAVKTQFSDLVVE